MIPTERWPQPKGGWPPWISTAPYLGAAHPRQLQPGPIGAGANCQRYAYGVLGLFDRRVPDHRSSELWEDQTFIHPALDNLNDLDLVLFNADDSAWGAHVAVLLDGQLLHLSAEVGRPAVWSWDEFAQRPQYATVIGAVRVFTARSRSGASDDHPGRTQD